MKTSFKFKFDSREHYLQGVTSTMEMLSSWKDNASTYKRDFDISPDIENNALIVTVEVNCVE